MSRAGRRIDPSNARAERGMARSCGGRDWWRRLFWKEQRGEASVGTCVRLQVHDNTGEKA